MTRFSSIFALSALMLPACSGDGNDGAVGTQASAECWVVSEDASIALLGERHSTQVEPQETLTLEELTGTSIRMSGVMVGTEARLKLRFERCLDLSRVRSIVFWEQGIDGPIEVGLETPTNLPPPVGSCVGAHCYAPREESFVESDGVSEQINWDDFQNGSPGAIADPYHVVGLTWTKHGEPGDRVDLTVSKLLAETLR